MWLLLETLFIFGLISATISTEASTTQQPTQIEPFFAILIRDIDNPSGLLANGEQCSKFSFIGVGCDYALSVAVAINDDALPTLPAPIQLHNNGQNKVSNLNQMFSASLSGTENSFSSFTLSVNLTSGNEIVDQYSVQINTTDPTGISTYTSTRSGILPTIISFAWSTNISPAVATTAAASTTSNAVETTTSMSIVSTLPPLPIDCDAIENRTNGVHTIYPDGKTGINVSCEYTEFGAYTTIQSRGSTNEINFNVSYTDYIQPIGAAGFDADFWLGLELMHRLTSNRIVSLQIDLCCGEALISRQIYMNFTIADSSTNYTLHAQPNRFGIGLDYASSTKHTDIGSPFATPETFSRDPYDCDELSFVSDQNVDVKPFGGWWYGGCGNNLNGYFLPPQDSCNNTQSFNAENPYLGINMRTSSDLGYEGFDVDLISFTRVRMAIFSFDPINVNKTSAEFCRK